MNGRIRVLVVEDSGFMRGVIRRILGADPEIEVVGLAADGVEAVRAVAALAPDVVTMDVNMPRADGLSAVARIMAERPTPILMISSYTRDGSAAAIRALELGAVDFIAKPSASVGLGLEELRETVVRKIKMAARVRPVRTAASRAAVSLGAGAALDVEATRNGHGWTPCVVIAASTGGPAALLQLIPALPPGLPASVLVIQHMPAPYTSQLARELAERAAIPVKEAEDRECLARGTVYVAPGSRHLTVSGHGRVTLHHAARNVDGCPSATLAMTSVSRHSGPLALGVVLTGMGRDGAEGVEAIRRVGGRAVAQDEASSLIYGMPRAAVETGCVDAVVPLSSLPDAIVTRVCDLGARAARVGRAS